MNNLQDVFLPCVKDGVFKETNPIMLAFIGDAVHTLFVRDSVVKSNNLLVKEYHKKSALSCRAISQAQKLDQILPILSKDEENIVRRARNAKTHSIAKNADIETYKKATSYEALIGYLYLKGNFSRLKEVLQ